MRDRDLYARILGIEAPWRVADVDLDLQQGEVVVHVEHSGGPEVDGVMQRAVQRGLRRREVRLPRRIGVDETSFQKRHEYVTVINDLDGNVVHVAAGHRQESLAQVLPAISGSGPTPSSCLSSNALILCSRVWDG